MEKETAPLWATANHTKALESAIERLALGEREALGEIYSICRISVYGFALSILKNTPDAEDVTQETFVKIYTEADKYAPEGKPMAWILTITKNLCLQRFRQTRRISQAEEDFERHEGGASDVDEVLDGVVLMEAMRILSDEERQIVILHAVSGVKHREIAKIMEMPLPTVLSKYNRAMKKLKKKMQGEE